MTQVFNSSYFKRLRQEDDKFRANLDYLVKAPNAVTKRYKVGEDLTQGWNT